MAKLEGKAALIGPVWFSIEPIKSSLLDEDATEYSLELWPNTDKGTFRHQFSVAEWQMKHDDIWIFARAFSEAHTLTDTTIPIDLGRNKKASSACLYEAITCVHAILWGNRKQRRIAIRLFVREPNDPTIFRTFFIQADAEATKQFGLQLEMEIIAASPKWAKESGLK